jgi:exonuclease V gamma subunit
MIWHDHWRTLQPMQDRIAACTEVAWRSFRLDTGHSLRIDGGLAVAPDQRIEIHPGGRYGKYLFAAWLRHVVWNVVRHRDASGPAGSGVSMLLTPVGCIQLPALAEADATTYLADLIEFARAALAEPQPFLPETAYGELFLSAGDASKMFAQDSARADWRRACGLGGFDPARRVDERPDSALIPVVRQIMQHREGIQEQRWQT